MDKLKMASSSFTDRLRSGGSQMSQKMKEILQSPSPESKIVDDATADTLYDPNWSLNLRICAMINSEEYSGTEIVKAIKKKLFSKSVVTQRLSLELLEMCTSNCDKVFSEMASEKVVEDMVKVIEDPKTDDEVGRRAFEMIRAWGTNDELMYLPVFHQTYMALKTRGILNGGAQPGNDQSEYNLESPVNEQYSIPYTNDQTSQYNIGGLSVEDNKEFLVITRNSLELLSCILDSLTEPALVKEDLTVTMLEKCKQSLPEVQRIAESTNDDEALLFEALNLHDELRQVISRCDELEASLVPSDQLTEVPESSTKVDLPIHVLSLNEVTREDTLSDDTKKAIPDIVITDLSLQTRNYSDNTKTDHLNADATEVNSALHVGNQSSKMEKEYPPHAETTSMAKEEKLETSEAI